MARFLLKLLWVGGTAFLLVASAQAEKSLGPEDIIFHFHGTTTSSLLGWHAVNTIGDVNKDGFYDIAVTSAVPEGTYVFFGGDPVDTFPDMFLWGRHGQPQSIDFDGDGIDEVVTSHVVDRYPVRSGALFFYKGYADSIGSEPYDSIWTESTVDGFGWHIRTAYVDSDSLGDLLTMKENVPGGHQLHYYSGGPTIDKEADWTYTAVNTDLISDNYGFIDFNGDGALDIFASHNFRDSAFVGIFLGPSYGQVPDIWLNPPAEMDTVSDQYLFGRGTSNAGDVNGDSWEDLGVCWGGAGIGLIYLCGPDVDTLFDYHLSNRTFKMASAGDFNGDGFDDLAANGNHGEFGGVDVYAGGPIFDEQLDGYIYKYDLPPLFLDEIGHNLSSAGDFNGDGYDDILFSCDNFASGRPGDAFIIAGGRKIVTDVADESESGLPSGYRLEQNYPNPFNSGTMIEFFLHERSNVTLEIFNILGRQARTLIDGELLPTGRHVVSWDGRLVDGQVAASGVYLYRLSTGDNHQVKKMILLK